MKHFSSTCDKPYDRHEYVLTFPNGRQQLFGDYETMRSFWFAHSQISEMVVSVIDVKSKPVGFNEK